MTLIKSLAVGIGFAALFAAYTLWFAAIGPRDDGYYLKILASIQFTALMTGLLVLFCVPHLIFAVAKIGRERIVDALAEQWPSMLRLSFWTLMGPALWTTAVVLLEPAPATWLELGLVPLITLVLGSVTDSKQPKHPSRGQRVLVYFAAALLIVGVAIIFVDISKPSFVGISILISGLGAVSTALAGSEIERIAKRSEIPFSLILSSRFLVTAIVFSAVSLLLGSNLLLKSSIASLISWGIMFFVVPNFLYVYLIWQTNLRQSAYMWALLPIFISSGERLWGFYAPTLSTPALLTSGALILIGAVCNLLSQQGASARKR